MTTLRSSADLPNLRDEPLVVDVETTSFDDEVAAFQPFNGHRIVGVAIGTLDATRQWYLPLRHQDGHNFPFEVGVSWLRDLLLHRHVVNHNIKFDGRFLHQDGVELCGKLSDTMVLARLVHNNLQGNRPYSLESLATRYLGQHKDDAVAAYCRSINTKDYGRTPVSIMGPYAETDVRLTAQLYQALLKQLPAISNPIWDIEQELTSNILETEIRGVKVDWDRLKRTMLECLRELDQLGSKIKALVGYDVDPLSNVELTKLLVDKLGIVPKAFTKTGKPQWNQIGLESLEHPVGKLLARFTSTSHFMASYCEGWLKRRGDDGRMHADFWQSGTKSGRWSCHDPNLQNIPPEAEIFLTTEPDMVLVAFDYSQMEYRTFAHYTKSDTILGEYLKNPYMDFHGHLAAMLGVDRQFAKQMNFSFIYGMGRKRLITNIAGLLAIKGAHDENMRETMRKYLTGAGTATAERAKQLNVGETTALANKIYDDYHRKFPEIRTFQKQVEAAVQSRGWIKNWYGRRYIFDEHAPRHKAVNYIIQGTAADCCKERIVAVHRQVPGCRMLMQVHDSIIFEVPRDEYQDFSVKVAKCLEDNPTFRVPMLVDTKVADQYLSQAFEVKERIELVGEGVYHDTLKAALEESKKVTMKVWGA